MPDKILCPPIRKFWMCRADGGKYTKHFLEHEVIALGHIDKIDAFDPKASKEKSTTQLSQFFKKIEKNKTTTTNHLHQVLHFVYDANVGDIVVSVNQHYFLLGRITSAPYFERKELIIKVPKGETTKDFEMGHYLRRKVKWISMIPRTTLPYALSKGITGHQTFFSLDEYEAQIYSTVSSFIYKDNILTTNFLIRKQNEISTYQFSKLTSVFLKVEFIANNWNKLTDVKSETELDKLFEQYCNSGEVTSSLIAEFSSPGRTSNQIKIPFGKAALFVLFLALVLRGGKFEILGFKAELKGLVTDEADTYIMENLTDEVLRLAHEWAAKDAKGVSEKLHLKYPGGQVNLTELEKKN